MRKSKPSEVKLPLPEDRWRLRDFSAAALLFLGSAAVTLWQNAHLTVLWDASYTLETSTRIALGQMPYRDFPLAHAYAGARTLRFADGPDEVHRAAIAKWELGKYGAHGAEAPAKRG